MATAVQEVTAATASNGSKPMTDVRMADSEKHTFTLNLPVALRDAIKNDAASRKNPATGDLGVADNTVAREILAAHYGINLVDNFSPRLRKGMTKEQKKAAREKTKARVQSIIEALASGKLSDEILKAAGISL